MINSSLRKKVLCGWLKDKHETVYNEPIKLQKFLFFYEVFQKCKEADYDFSGLKQYRYGPVFSAVYGDFTHERETFDSEVTEAYQQFPQVCNIQTAAQSAFLVEAIPAFDLSELSHQYHFWLNAGDLDGEEQPCAHDLCEKDFDSHDICLTENLLQMFPYEYCISHISRVVGRKSFIFSLQDNDRLTDLHLQILQKLSADTTLLNPVFVEIDDNGGLIID